MAGNYKKEDLRIIKTQKAFKRAIKFLLEHRKFKQITVNDLCEEALTSRAAFYAHYKDKYDLLENFFNSLADELKGTGLANMIECVIYRDIKIMQNIMYEADAETIKIVHSFIYLLLDSSNKLTQDKKNNPQYILFSNFYVGGICEIIKWQNEQKNQTDILLIKHYVIELTRTIVNFYINYENQ